MKNLSLNIEQEKKKLLEKKQMANKIVNEPIKHFDVDCRECGEPMEFMGFSEGQTFELHYCNDCEITIEIKEPKGYHYEF